MTNEEIIKFLQSKQIPQCGDKEYTADEEYEAYQKAIQALEQNESAEEWYKLFVEKLDEQEPCEDAISKQAVLDTISELNAISFYEAQEDSKECYYEIRQAVENIQPVTAQQK